MARRRGDRSAVVAPDPSRAPTETTSKYWGVSWCKKARRWKAQYQDADGKKCQIGLFDTEEAAAHAVNAAIGALPQDVQRRRHTNPVVDGQLVPCARMAPGHGVASRKRRREEPAAPPPAPSRRRVVSAPPPARDDVALDRTAAYLETAATPADADGFRAAAGLALACLDAVANVASV